MPGYADANPSRPSPGGGGAESDSGRFLKYEFLPNFHLPDLRRVHENGVVVSVACGKGSQDVFYARTMIE